MAGEPEELQFQGRAVSLDMGMAGERDCRWLLMSSNQLHKSNPRCHAKTEKNLFENRGAIFTRSFWSERQRDLLIHEGL